MTKHILYLHCGAHKTATTALQNFFLKHEELFIDQDITYVRTDEINNSGLIPFLHGDKHRSPNEADQHYQYFRNLIDNGKTNHFLVCHESIFSFAGDPGKGRIYPTLETALDRLHLVNCFDEIRFFFCFREPASFLQSLFLQNLGNTFVGDFEEYLHSVKYENLNWLFIPKAFESAWPDSQVTFQIFERIKFNQTELFMKKIFDWLAVPFKSDYRLAMANESLSTVAANMLSASGLSYKNMSADTRKALRRFLKENFPSEKYGKANYLNERVCSEIRSILRKDHFQLFHQYLDPEDISLWGYSNYASSDFMLDRAPASPESI